MSSYDAKQVNEPPEKVLDAEYQDKEMKLALGTPNEVLPKELENFSKKH